MGSVEVIEKAVQRLRKGLNGVHNVHWNQTHDDLKTVLDRLENLEESRRYHFAKECSIPAESAHKLSAEKEKKVSALRARLEAVERVMEIVDIERPVDE